MAQAHRLCGPVSSNNTRTSVDEPWTVDLSLKWRDRYVLVTSAFWLIPKMLIFGLPLLILQLPFTAVLCLYARTLPIPCETPNRLQCGYRCLCVAAFIVGFPMLLVAKLALLLDYLFYYLFGVLFCTFTCGWSTYCKSIAALKPYTGGPWALLYWSDIVTCFIGQVWRHGYLEGNFMLLNMWLCMPWLKYYVNCNPWTHPLEHRMVQQISTSMQDMSLAELSKAGLQIISRTKQTPGLQADIDNWRFVPHYAYPPPWRRWAVGMQAGGRKVPYVFFLLTHVTHALCRHCGTDEQYVVSNSVAVAGYRVMLWYNNPYHFLTGLVEASLTDGRKGSQPEKNRGGEHPMWLVTSRSPMLSNRGSFTGSGWIDDFFDQWLPTIVNALRKINRGDTAVEELKEGVISKDGKSRPEIGKKVPLVAAGDVESVKYDVVRDFY
eukprot:TRINITY_DN4051_c0_g1_i3.p1 TRINITY_DN4051_c0_g1~~TRINITY_DN4051_c0_g1_i3.p1  ORF type:complete len:435 (+),score=40.12 TRINITY_DN4051_c0_g1_i3:239-1543(+)